MRRHEGSKRDTMPRYRGGSDSFSRQRSKFDSHYRTNERNIARASEFRGSRGPRLEDIPKGKSAWDVAPPGLEGFTPQQVKLLSIISPGSRPSKSQTEEISSRLSVRSLKPETSALNRSLIVEGDIQAAKDYISSTLSSVRLGTKMTVNGSLVELEGPKHVAVLLACPGSLILRRPPGLVTSDSVDIWSNESTQILDIVQPLGPDCEKLYNTEGQFVAAFSKSQHFNSRSLYPVRNTAPAMISLDKLGVIPAVPSCTLVVMNGGAGDDLRQILESLGSIEIKIHQGSVTTKMFAKFSSAEACQAAGSKLHEMSFKGFTLLCGFWNDEAFDLNIF